LFVWGGVGLGDPPFFGFPGGGRLRVTYANTLQRVDEALKETTRETVHDGETVSGREVLADLRAKAE